MLARLQQLVVFSLLFAIGVWAACSLSVGHPLWMLAGPLAIVGLYAAILGFEFWLLRNSYDSDAADCPTASELARAWRDEVLVAPRVFLWRQPFRCNAIPDRPSRTERGGRGIVFVHGFVCNRGLWNPWLQRLLPGKIPFVALTLEPTFGSIDRYVTQIDAAVQALEVSTGSAPVIVAHSMGGLAVRAWLAGGGRAERFHRIVTIASPHSGTWMARYGHTDNGLQMRIGSPWLQGLERMESVTQHSRFTCFWGHCDNIVFPTRGATLPGADNRHLQATPHVAMAYHPAVFDEVLRLVNDS